MNGPATEETMMDGGICVRVMTEEQMETLRKQIAVYATICEKLVEMHRAYIAHQDSLAALRTSAGIYGIVGGGGGGGDHLLSGGISGVQKTISTRQRWTPTTVQLQILEKIFEQGTGTPTKQKIKEITSHLSNHGHISETNVYNWFQNRRARTKRKQSKTATSSSATEEFSSIGEAEPEKTKYIAAERPPEKLRVKAHNGNDLGCDHIVSGEVGGGLANTSGGLGGVQYYENSVDSYQPRLEDMAGRANYSSTFGSFGHV